jgi:hypothetical protein
MTVMPEEKRVDDVEKLLSDEKSLGDRKQTPVSEEKSLVDRKQILIDDLLKQRDAANAAFDEKLAKLGYHANTNHEPQPGDKMPDGTIYAGISPDSGKKMYAMPADASLTMAFNEATDYAQTLSTQKGYGHDDWHVPTKNELNLLFNSRAKIRGFNVSGSAPSGWYWSSSSNDIWDAWGQRFSDGYQGNIDKDNHSSVRLVR